MRVLKVPVNSCWDCPMAMKSGRANLVYACKNVELVPNYERKYFSPIPFKDEDLEIMKKTGFPAWCPLEQK